MIFYRMNIWWENIVQLGIPLLIVIVTIIIAIVLVRKENKKNYLVSFCSSGYLKSLISKLCICI